MKKALLLVVLILSLFLFAACSIDISENSSNQPYQQYMNAYHQSLEEESFVMEISLTNGEVTIQLVQDDSGDMAIINVVGERMSDDPIIKTLYFRDGWLYQTLNNQENFRRKQEKNIAMEVATSWFLDFPKDVIATQSAKDTADGRLLTFVMASEKYYEYRTRASSESLVYGESSFYRESPVITVLLDQQGRIKQITQHEYEIDAKNNEISWDNSGTITITQYGNVELDFSELNDEDFPEREL